MNKKTICALALAIMPVLPIDHEKCVSGLYKVDGLVYMTENKKGEKVSEVLLSRMTLIRCDEYMKLDIKQKYIPASYEK